jgi:Rad3-related DNA helicase
LTVSTSTDSEIDKAKELFPYEFKSQQEAMLEQLLRHPHVLWHAPTGFGKTVVALVSFLHHMLNQNRSIKRIIVMVRMKTQIFRILDEAFTIASHFFTNYEELTSYQDQRASLPAEIISLPLIGKDELCINPQLTSQGFNQGQIDCKALKCKFFDASYPKGDELEELILTYFMKDLKITSDIKEFLTVETPALCPYYILKSMLRKAHIVVTTHAWLLNPQLSKSLFEELSIEDHKTAIIIDEVHNFRAHMTGKITYNQVRTATMFAFRNNLQIKDYLSEIELQFRKHKLTKSKHLIAPDEDWRLDSIQYIINEYTGKPIPQEKDRKGLKALKQIHTFLATEGNLWFFDKDHYIDHKGNKLYYKVMKRVLAFPESILCKISSFNRVIFMSGTLYPPKAYMTLYGLDESFQLVEVPKESRKIQYLNFVHPNMSSRQKNRSIGLFKTLSQIIKQLHDLNPNHTLVFSTSKAFTGDLKKIFGLSFPGMEAYSESTSQQNQIILEKLRLKRHELIFATLAGGFSEGVEIKDRGTEASKITMIIFTGLPHPPPTLTQQLLEEQYLKRFGQKNTIFFLKWLPIYQTILQAAGRGIRRPTDKCIIVSLDYRLPNLGIFPEEFSRSYAEFDRLTDKIIDFF